ncbi:hypothetical protein CK203_052273 [Vitis vinifera]|uniref:Uncharacterized protein n=1 Tax=Vitis vinifera TaxID=29760 RepID=A0A438FWE7_VITVI|nr:hypothetical protein CK203_052273 [Vitis vinifera]
MDFSNSLGKGGCDTLLKVPSGEGKEWQGTTAHKMLLQQQILRNVMAMLKHSDFVTSSSGLCMLMEASRARMIEGHPYLEFASSDIGDPTVGTRSSTLTMEASA